MGFGQTRVPFFARQLLYSTLAVNTLARLGDHSQAALGVNVGNRSAGELIQDIEGITLHQREQFLERRQETAGDRAGAARLVAEAHFRPKHMYVGKQLPDTCEPPVLPCCPEAVRAGKTGHRGDHRL